MKQITDWERKVDQLETENAKLRKAMSEWMPNAIERLQLRTAWIADYGSAADKMEELYVERARLCEALKQARQFALIQGYTSREFAQCIGITPTQLSAWTDEIPNREPDFKD